MNHSKKTLKGKKPVKKVKRLTNPKIGFAVIIVLSVILVIILSFEQLYKPSILTINGDKYKMKDLMYYFYTKEAEYEQYEQFYQQLGSSYWNMSSPEDATKTMRDTAKDETMLAAIKNEVLYREAKAEGYSLTDDEKVTIKSNVDNLYKSLTKEQKELTGFTKKYLTEYIGKSTLVARYRQDKIDSFPIDDEAIKARLKFEDYRQYDIEYLKVSTKNAAGSDMTADEKKAAYDKLNAISEEAKKSSDWSKLLPEDEKDITYASDNFTENGGKFPEDFEKMMKSMENDQISDIFESEDGYYLVKMKNNKSTENYDSSVKDAISSEEEKSFNDFYVQKLMSYKYKINNKELKKLTMGEITIPKK